MLAVVREVLNQKSLEGALDEVERANRSFAMNLLIGGPHGIMDLEVYPDRILTRRSQDMIWHTNHCMYAEGLRYENDDFRANSVLRCERIDTLLHEKLPYVVCGAMVNAGGFLFGLLSASSPP